MSEFGLTTYTFVNLLTCEFKHDQLLYRQAFIYLCAASQIAVPLAKRFGLGSVLGYLIAGVVIGPVVGLVGDRDCISDANNFAECRGCHDVGFLSVLDDLSLGRHSGSSCSNRLLGLANWSPGWHELQVILIMLVTTDA